MHTFAAFYVKIQVEDTSHALEFADEGNQEHWFNRVTLDSGEPMGVVVPCAGGIEGRSQKGIFWRNGFQRTCLRYPDVVRSFESQEAHGPEATNLDVGSVQDPSCEGQNPSCESPMSLAVRVQFHPLPRINHFGRRPQELRTYPAHAHSFTHRNKAGPSCLGYCRLVQPTHLKRMVLRCSGSLRFVVSRRDWW